MTNTCFTPVKRKTICENVRQNLYRLANEADEQIEYCCIDEIAFSGIVSAYVKNARLARTLHGGCCATARERDAMIARLDEYAKRLALESGFYIDCAEADITNYSTLAAAYADAEMLLYELLKEKEGEPHEE